MSDQVQIRSILGAVAAVVFGWVAGLFFPQIMIHTGFPAALFSHLLQLLTAPLLFTAVVVGVATFGDMVKVRRSFTKLLWYFLGTGAAAALLALLLTLLFQPGHGISWGAQTGTVQFDDATSYSFGAVLQGIIPLSLPGSISNGYFVGLVLFAFAIGFFLIQAGFKGRPFSDLLSIFLGLQKQILKIISYILPVGLFFVIGSAVAANSGALSSTLQSISGLFPLLLVTLLVFGLLVLPAIQWFLTGESPIRYLLNIKPAIATAFAAGSTTAAFPVLYQCASDQQNDERVSGTALPFGLLLATHGSTILTVMLTLFTAQAIGVSLGLWQILLLLLAAIFVPVGIVGFPAAQLVLFGGLFHLLQFPAEAYSLLAIIWSGEWLISRFVAPVNVMSSAVGAAVVAASFDLKTARHTAPPPQRSSGFHRQDGPRRQGQYSSEQRGKYRDERTPEQRTDRPAGGPDRPRYQQGRDRDRFDRNKPREERGEQRQSSGQRDRRHENRPNRFQGNRDDRRRFPQDRPPREAAVETTQETTHEREPIVTHTEERTESRPFTAPVVSEKPVEHTEQTSNVSYGRTSRPKVSERETSDTEQLTKADSEKKSGEREPDFPASNEVSYGRSRRRPDFVKNESASESSASSSANEEESVVTGEVSFGRGRRRPPGR